MLTQDLIALYAPHNAKNLTQEQLAAMAGFKKEDLKQLAEAHPNGANTYLILKDTTKPDNKQIFPTSTWKNLYELIKVGQKQFVPISFRNIFNKKDFALKVAPVQDLTKDEVNKELKTAAPQTGMKAVPGKSAGVQTAKEKGSEEEVDVDADAETEKVVEEKPLEKMNKKELLAKYLVLFNDEAPEELATNRQLIAAIKEKMEETK